MGPIERWLSVSRAAARLGVSEHDMREMAIKGEVRARLILDHWEIAEDAVAALIAGRLAGSTPSELATSRGDVLAENGVSVRGGPDIGDDAEDEYRQEKMQ
jgi:hypothetical protein